MFAQEHKAHNELLCLLSLFCKDSYSDISENKRHSFIAVDGTFFKGYGFPASSSCSKYFHT